MIVFGTRAREVSGPRKQGVVCSHCGQDRHATRGVLRYFHLFWIPVFPTQKQPTMECLHCKKVLTGNEIPEPARREITASLFTRGRMLPMFSGLFLFAVLMGFGLYSSARKSREAEIYLAAPVVGDLYVVKMARFAKSTDPKFPYGLLRVASVRDDKVELQLGQEGYSRAAGAESALRAGKHRESTYFSSDTLQLAVKDLLPIKTAGDIEEVERP